MSVKRRFSFSPRFPLWRSRNGICGQRTALRAGSMRINLHPNPSPIEPQAKRPTVGAADFCVVTDVPADEMVAILDLRGIPVELGPVQRMGACGEMTSVYLRDPDQNLVELAFYPR